MHQKPVPPKAYLGGTGDFQDMLNYQMLFHKLSAKLRKTGQTVNLDHAGLTLNQRKTVVDKALCHMVAVGVDPHAGILFLKVGNLVEINQFGIAHITAVTPVALKTDHLTRMTGQRRLNSSLTSLERLLNISTGGQMRGSRLNSIPRTLAPVFSFRMLASIEASPPSWACPNPSFSEVLASATKVPSA